MSIVDSTMINVLNYTNSMVSVPTQINKDGYMFEACLDENQPTIVPLSYSEITFVNSQSQIFKEGYLKFDKEIEAELYEKLGIRNWQNILTDYEIKNIILNPTAESLEKLVNISTLSLFDRVRGMLTQLVNSDTYDISNRVVKLIETRYTELYNGKRRSEIEITKHKIEATENNIKANPTIDIEQIKADLMKQIRAEMVAEMNASAKSNISNNDKNLDVITIDTSGDSNSNIVNPIRRAGRPPKIR